jgi:uncharacterized membrane-anchored protein YhcB (DUF1043 family)
MFNLFSIPISPEGWKTIRQVVLFVLCVVFLVGGGYYLGKKAEQTAQAERKVVALEKYQKDTETLREQRDELQKKYANKTETVRIEYREVIKYVDKTETELVDQLRNDKLRLSVRLRDAEASAATANLAASAIGTHAERRAELHEETATALIRLTSDADRTAVTLGSCQRYIQLQYDQVNEYNSKNAEFYKENGYTF